MGDNVFRNEREKELLKLLIDLDVRQVEVAKEMGLSRQAFSSRLKRGNTADMRSAALAVSTRKRQIQLAKSA